MRILKLEAENVKRLTAVSIEPDGSLILIGGKNSAGKTSTLDSIGMGLFGPDVFPAKPVRRGEQKAKIKLSLGDKEVELIVRRTITAAGGHSLIITDPDGAKKGTAPQHLLDELVGRISFDPLKFASDRPLEQAKTLRELVGLDFTETDKERAKAYEDRTLANREVASLRSRLQAMPPAPAELPAEEVSTTDLIKEQAKAAQHNKENEEIRQRATTASRAHRDAVEAYDKEKQVIKELEDTLEAHRKRLDQLGIDCGEAKTNRDHAMGEASKCEDIDLDQFATKVSAAEQVNALIRSGKARAELRKQLAEKNKVADNLSDRIEAIDRKKREAIAGAKYPVDGLGFDDTGALTYNGVPFDQAGTREQIAVSVAIGLALNKKLKVLLIRRGSEVDSDGLKLIAEMAEKAKAQVWMEVVREDKDVSVVIEDGHVKGQDVSISSTSNEAPKMDKASEQQEMGITP